RARAPRLFGGAGAGAPPRRNGARAARRPADRDRHRPRPGRARAAHSEHQHGARMSFLTALALGLAVLVIAPTLAHLLRRGRAQEQDFPPTRLVPLAKATTRERSKLEDRGLLLLRALLIIALSILGAGPLVRCSRVALGRSGGASVALAIVVDDSASM